MHLQGPFGNTVSDTKAEMFDKLKMFKVSVGGSHASARPVFLGQREVEAVSRGQLLPGPGGLQGQFWRSSSCLLIGEE